MDDVSFNTLIDQARSGDETAVAAILDRFEPEIRTIVRARLPRILRNQLDSMDIVQAIWTSVLTGKTDEVAKFSDSKHFRGFLIGVARNKVFEEYRRRTKTKKYDMGREERLYVRKGERDIPLDLPGSDPTPSEEVQAEDRLDQINRGLSSDEIQMVALRRQGLTFDEIAKRIGTNERSVRRVINSIRERMEDREWR